MKAKMKPCPLLQLYAIIRIQLGALERYVNSFATVALFMLHTLGVSGMFSTVAMQPPLIPIPIYFVCPFFAVAAFVLFYMFLTPVCRSYEQFQYLLQELESKALGISSGHERKMFSRQVKSLRIISASAGLFDYRFFPLKRSMKTTFLDAMVSLSITLMMAASESYDKFKSTN